MFGVRFVNSAFWGPSNQVARSTSRGLISFDACTFVDWDAHKLGRAALQVASGSLLVRGCLFQRKDAVQLQIGAGVDGAVVTSNIFSGKQQVLVDPAAQNTEVQLNVVRSN